MDFFDVGSTLALQNLLLKLRIIILTGKEFNKKLHAGDRMFGTLITSTSQPWIKLPQHLGLDFVFIDSEHYSLTPKEIYHLCQINYAAGIIPLVRIAQPDASLACLAIEWGAKGVIAPYIETKGQILELAGAVKYRPLKGKFLQESLKTGKLDSVTKKYLEKMNEEFSLIINIESVPAVDILPDVLDIKELDGVLIGPHDMTISMGIPEQYEHPKYLQTVDTIIKQARNFNIGVGIHSWTSIAQDKKWIDSGLNFLIHASDYLAAKSKLAEDLNELKR